MSKVAVLMNINYVHDSIFLKGKLSLSEKPDITDTVRTIDF